MLLVVVLITMLAGAGGAIYIGTYNKLLTAKCARNFLLAAKYARILAIEQQTKYSLLLDAEQNSFCLTVESTDSLTGSFQTRQVRDLYSKPVTFAGKVKFEGINITSTNEDSRFETEQRRTIVFYPNGTADRAIVQIGDGKNHYTAAISTATGKTKVVSGTAENVTSDSIDLDLEGQG